MTQDIGIQKLAARSRSIVCRTMLTLRCGRVLMARGAIDSTERFRCSRESDHKGSGVQPPSRRSGLKPYVSYAARLGHGEHVDSTGDVYRRPVALGKLHLLVVETLFLALCRKELCEAVKNDGAAGRGKNVLQDTTPWGWRWWSLITCGVSTRWVHNTNHVTKGCSWEGGASEKLWEERR
jgi:hypothetical protein